MHLSADDLDLVLMGGQAMTWRPADGAWEGPIGDDWCRIGPGPTVLEGPERAVRRLLRVEGPEAADLVDDDALSPWAGRMPRLRVLRQPVWTGTLTFLLSAANNVKRIRGTLHALADATDRTDQEGRWTLPPPEEVAALGESGLRRAGSGYRATTIHAIARAITDGNLDLDAHLRGDLDEAVAVLTEHKGIGPKVAHCICAYALDIGAAFPIDRHVHRATGGRWTMDAARERWGDRASLAQQVLFEASWRGLLGPGPSEASTSRRDGRPSPG